MKTILGRTKKTIALMLSALTVFGAVTTYQVAAEDSDASEFQLALQIYNIGPSYTNEIGQPVTITGDGQYTVTFDIATDLSDDAVAKGVTSISEVGAIYIKDYAVSNQTADKSPITAGRIVYDSVEVDGTKLTINDSTPKDLLTDAGIVDTGAPINSWSGSLVDEVNVDSAAFTTSFSTVTNPQKISVTFTLSGLDMGGQDPTTFKIGSDAPTTVEAGKTADIVYAVTPVTKDVFSITSSDESVATIESSKVQADADGNITATVEGVSAGKATITITAADDVTTTYEIEVTGTTVTDETTVAASSDQDESGFPTWAIVTIACVGAAVVVAIILVSVLKKKKK